MLAQIDSIKYNQYYMIAGNVWLGDNEDKVVAVDSTGSEWSLL